MDEIITADFFCGCGGFSTGFEREGFNTVFGIDIDPAQLETYSENHENVALVQEDVRKLSPQDISNALDSQLDRNIEIDDIEAVIGGPPCEGFSIAGDRDEGDPRNQLFRHYFNLVEEINPRIVIMENVEGILSMEIEGQEAPQVIAERLVDMGFSIDECWELRASDFGVPQKRDRVFFVGARDIEIPPPPVETERDISVWEAISDLPSLEAGESKERYEREARTQYQKEMRDDCRMTENGEAILFNHRAYNHGTNTVARFELTRHGKNYTDIPEYDEYDDYVPSKRYNSRHNKLVPYEAAFTVTSHCNDEMVHYNDARVLTVRECARLQSFPDNYVFKGPRSNGHGSDPENQYEQVGNAVPPNLAQSIAHHIRKIAFEGEDPPTRDSDSQDIQNWIE